MNILLDLFLTFGKIGLFTFGGGYAMIAMIEHNCVERKHWITYDEMMDITVIAESTPGPIAINCATFVGYKQAGFIGAVAATLGIVVPSFAIIYVISMFLDNFMQLALVANAFKGIKAAVGIIILDAALTMLKKMPKKPFPRAVAVCSFAAKLAINVFSLRFSSITLIIIAAVAGISVFKFNGAPDMKGGEAK